MAGVFYLVLKRRRGSGILTAAGALLVAIGIFIRFGWPFVIAGLVLLVVVAGSR